ncbi:MULTISPECIES: tryptophan halogenase family protein [unclassified Pseudoxanthomonas]|uniref:tryptophan halogenase family protein n=1 Tax=unclassified Pseudoxanthomonas TaxID=2645906 RepID=UPI0008E0B3CE|nr:MULTISPECIES: tryptophan halogenase family protein [unclassified Pseudoxanthomonas]PPJ41346.1 tryptophan 7-halogenase [Pseudoxanthomonas sp. KAs_5_3]SFV30553.1 tryptophan halogenase [Pseudoxanthomonas sp. YR558]
MHNQDPIATPRTIKRVVIAGGGTAGWMAAAALSKTLGKTLDITLVESEEIGTVGVGEATIPTLVVFHRLLDIKEQDFMAAVQGTVKLGISFEHWKELGHRYIHSFGISGKDHWSAGFQHFWLRGHAEGIASDYSDYCIELQAALQDRFSHLPRYHVNYAYHMDAALYARFLRGFSERHGCKRIEGKIVDVATDADGCISSIKLERGDVIEGDLFIDCTGFRALLIGKALGVGYTDWSQWLFNDSALATQTTAVRDAVPYTRAIAGTAGWQWRIPLQHRVGNGIVYSSRHISDDEAREQFLSSVEGEVIKQPWPIRFKPGQRQQCWAKNCVALGLAGSFIEPLESTTIHLIQRGIVRLLQTFPQAITQPAIDEYNARLDEELQHVRDFVVMHYHVSDRRDTPYWREIAEMEIPATLRHRIELFRETGTVFHVPGELFGENSWIQVMMGQGIVPKRYHPTADVMSPPDLQRFLDDIRRNVLDTARQMPAHMDYLRSYCPAPKP